MTNLLPLQRDTSPNWFTGGCLLGEIAIRHSAPPWSQSAPSGKRALIYEIAPRAGWRWRIVSESGEVEAAGFILLDCTL
jgi:hypothetical protein